jgi:hypothetical protein
MSKADILTLGAVAASCALYLIQAGCDDPVPSVPLSAIHRQEFQTLSAKNIESLERKGFCVLNIITEKSLTDIPNIMKANEESNMLVVSNMFEVSGNEVDIRQDSLLMLPTVKAPNNLLEHNCDSGTEPHLRKYVELLCCLAFELEDAALKGTYSRTSSHRLPSHLQVCAKKFQLIQSKIRSQPMNLTLYLFNSRLYLIDILNLLKPAFSLRWR